MTAEQLIYSVNDIDDSFINEYAEAESVKKNKINGVWKEVIGFACLILIFCIPTILMVSKSGEGNTEVTTHSFVSYTEMCEILPKDHILSNIPDAESGKFKCEGKCSASTTDFTNYTFLRTYVRYEYGTVTIAYTKNAKTTAESAFKSSAYADEEVKSIVINGVEVLYCYLSNLSGGINMPSPHWVARFSVGKDLYELELYSFDEERVIDYIERLMEQ